MLVFREYYQRRGLTEANKDNGGTKSNIQVTSTVRGPGIEHRTPNPNFAGLNPIWVKFLHTSFYTD